jgi:hypothetical protein
MNALLAAESSSAFLGIVPTGMLVVAIIINVSSLQTKDTNRKSCHAATLLFIALILGTAAWTVRSFGGGSEVGVFWALIAAALLHIVSAAIGLLAYREHRTIGRWPYGRRRATWGFWLNVIALAALAAWFYVCADPKLYKRIFE